MKRNLLAVLLVLPLVFLAVHSAPASGLPTGYVTATTCGIGGAGASCWKYCCTSGGTYLRTLSAHGFSTTCTTAYTKCTGCMPACNPGEIVCNSGGGCL